jgi:hypothetical protein
MTARMARCSCWHGIGRGNGMTTAKIMPALFEFLYREFCRARLAEMRKPLLIRPDGLEVLEDACFDGHADRWNGLGELQDEADNGKPI